MKPKAADLHASNAEAATASAATMRRQQTELGNANVIFDIKKFMQFGSSRGIRGTAGATRIIM
eukprot:CAMPEP_0179210938 /NCGR_PEP_ID=MMETSP0797-20121207/71_1 /TAXON_ID=47934 /ORGANISM="Dinophysis acuminata, Strain DAEP01" /LENGTH=62 /DNA_ID=CAMNT_0020915981 /DNA_START=104 /DNA_END=293 /DNA_ORIENTATION=-